MTGWLTHHDLFHDHSNVSKTLNLEQLIALERREYWRTVQIVGVLTGGLVFVSVHDLASYGSVTLFVAAVVGFLVRFNTRIVRLEWEAEQNKAAHVALEQVPARLAAIERSLELTAGSLERLQILPVALERLTTSVEDHYRVDEQRNRKQGGG